MAAKFAGQGVTVRGHFNSSKEEPSPWLNMEMYNASAVSAGVQ